MSVRIPGPVLVMIFLLGAVSASDGLMAASSVSKGDRGKPWMLFVNSLYPPRGPSMEEAFSRACFERLKPMFDTTSYQVILLGRGQFPEHLTNRKKDIVLSSDKTDFLVRGETHDTLVFWMKYMVGFTHARVAVPFKRQEASKLPDLVAHNAFQTAMAEFMGHLTLEGGPPGVALTVAPDLVAYPPCEFFIPPGRYGICASSPGYCPRTDTIEIFPGRFYRKRMLLLPAN